jgi:SAM-dependent methyltransferase
MTTSYLPEVKEQYEALPYPPCDPEDDKKQLTKTWLDDLPMINHYCFAGRQRFENRFRVLVAGGGTGDATIFLAQQLQHTDAEIVHVDLSGASIDIARRRADIRGLKNISWIQDSLLNLPQLGLEKFDYINCVGVLHHLENPDAGLRALRAVLKDTGALGLMVYGKYGRTAVYQTQALMRMVNSGEMERQRQIDNTTQILKHLPQSNWFKRGEDLYADHRNGDAGIYDLLLHSQDQAYTVGELFDWLQDQHGLNLEFTCLQRGRAPYLPHMVLGPHQPEILNRIRAMTFRRQCEIAELMSGRITMHSFFATGSVACKAPYGEPDFIPFFFHEPLSGPLMAQVYGQNNGQTFQLNHVHSGVSIQAAPGKYGRQILHYIDGRRTFQQIFDLVRTQVREEPAPANDVLFKDFAAIFDTLNALDRLLLRHVSTDLPREYA